MLAVQDTLSGCCAESKLFVLHGDFFLESVNKTVDVAYTLHTTCVTAVKTECVCSSLSIKKIHSTIIFCRQLYSRDLGNFFLAPVF